MILQNKTRNIAIGHTILTSPDSPAVPALESDIDRPVYHLYNLTPDEIAIIEEQARFRRYFSVIFQIFRLQ